MEILTSVVLSKYEEALGILENFSKNPNLKFLQEASYKLLDYIREYRNHAPSYFCLSYIFYALDNTEFAMKFMKEAEQISPDVPDELKKLRNKILNEGARYKSYEFDTNKQVSFSMPSKPSPAKTLADVKMPVPIKVSVNKTSSFWKVMSN